MKTIVDMFMIFIVTQWSKNFFLLKLKRKKKVTYNMVPSKTQGIDYKIGHCKISPLEPKRSSNFELRARRLTLEQGEPLIMLLYLELQSTEII